MFENILTVISVLGFLWLTVIFITIVSAIFLQKKKDSGILQMTVAILFKIAVIWPMKCLSNSLILFIIAFVVAWFFIGFFALSVRKENLYLYLVLMSFFFAYLSPLIIKFLLHIAKLINDTQYNNELKSTYTKLFKRINFRGLTYIILLSFYLIKNFFQFQESILVNEFTNNLLLVSNEALLTFVIVDTIISIYKVKISNLWSKIRIRAKIIWHKIKMTINKN